MFVSRHKSPSESWSWVRWTGIKFFGHLQNNWTGLFDCIDLFLDRLTYFSWSSTICSDVIGRLSGKTFIIKFFTFFCFNILCGRPIRSSATIFRSVQIYCLMIIVSIWCQKNVIYIPIVRSFGVIARVKICNRVEEEEETRDKNAKIATQIKVQLKLLDSKGKMWDCVIDKIIAVN